MEIHDAGVSIVVLGGRLLIYSFCLIDIIFYIIKINISVLSIQCIYILGEKVTDGITRRHRDEE